MEQIKKDQIVDQLVAMAYFWIGDRSYQPALTIYRWLSKLSVSTEMDEKIKGLGQDLKTLFPDEKESNYPEMPIPGNKTTEDEKLLWVTATIITNTFASTNFEMAYKNMMEMCADWPELYLTILKMLRNSDAKDMITEWAAIHFLFAIDLAQDKNLSVGGYKLVKDE